jgi:hypothetical protein
MIMAKKEIVLCSGKKCKKAKDCYYNNIDPTLVQFNKVKVVDSLNTTPQYECVHFKLYAKVTS